MEKQEVYIKRFTDENFHHVHITIPNESFQISHDGDNLKVHARWDKDRFQMPIINK